MDPAQLINATSLPLKNKGVWTHQEHALFLQALELFPNSQKSWKEISNHVKTRSQSQVRSHAQKYNNKKENDRKKIENQKIPDQILNAIQKTRSKLDLNAFEPKKQIDCQNEEQSQIQKAKYEKEKEKKIIKKNRIESINTNKSRKRKKDKKRSLERSRPVVANSQKKIEKNINQEENDSDLITPPVNIQRQTQSQDIYSRTRQQWTALHKEEKGQNSKIQTNIILKNNMAENIQMTEESKNRKHGFSPNKFRASKLSAFIKITRSPFK